MTAVPIANHLSQPHRIFSDLIQLQSYHSPSLSDSPSLPLRHISLNPLVLSRLNSILSLADVLDSDDESTTYPSTLSRIGDSSSFEYTNPYMVALLPYLATLALQTEPVNDVPGSQYEIPSEKAILQVVLRHKRFIEVTPSHVSPIRRSGKDLRAYIAK